MESSKLKLQKPEEKPEGLTNALLATIIAIAVTALIFLENFTEYVERGNLGAALLIGGIPFATILVAYFYHRNTGGGKKATLICSGLTIFVIYFFHIVAR